MNTQEQIDFLKREVLNLNQQVFKMTQAIHIIANDPSTPSCGECGMGMYEGATCCRPASDCLCGIGQPEAQGE